MEMTIEEGVFYRLVTDNVQRTEEFQRYGLEGLTFEPQLVSPDESIPPLKRAIKLSNGAGKGSIIELSHLQIQGFDQGDSIRWSRSSVSTYEGRRATWNAYLGVNDGETIKIYRGQVEGELTTHYYAREAEGFDCFFKPFESPLTLYELGKLNGIGSVSAHKRAIDTIKTERPVITVKRSALRK